MRTRMLCFFGMLLATVQWAQAQDACTPSRFLAANTVITIDRQSSELAPVLSARLATPLLLRPGAPGLDELGLGAGATTATLPRRVLASRYAIGTGVLVNDAATLGFSDGNGPLLVRSDGRSYQLDVRDRKAFGHRETQPVMVAPALLDPVDIILPAGTKVTATGAGGARVEAGGTIEWVVNDDKGLSLTLLQSVPLREVNALQSAASVSATKPRSTLPGSKLTVKLLARDIDLKKSAPLFCFTLADAAGTGTGASIGVPGEQAKSEGEYVDFTVVVPDRLGKLATAGTSVFTRAWWLDLVRGTPLLLRVLVQGEKGLAVDSQVLIALSSRAKSIGVALLTTGIMLFVMLRWLGAGGAANLARNLCTNKFGHYSLANVQVLMWSVVVLFALFFVWWATGEILSISSGVLTLLGVSGGTLVAARTVESFDPNLQQKKAPPSLSDLISSEGKFDVPRFQMLAFTLFAIVYALMAVLRGEGLPDLPDNLLLLMGISNATYVAGKLPAVLPGGATAPVAGATPGTDVDALKALQAKLNVAPSGVLDDATSSAIVAFKRNHSLIPASPALSDELRRKIMQTG